MRLLVLVVVLAPLSACGSGISACGNESDITGSWDIVATPLAIGADALPASFSIDAELIQADPIDFLGIGHFVHGTLTASDSSVFGMLTIPELKHNSGDKSGAILACKIGIHIPIAAPVTDDNVKQGPNRIALSGQVTMKGHMESVVSTDPTDDSSVILESDAENTVRKFSWTGTQR
ncbi:MAG: hypothetical protein ABI321_24915 [Polyangia bacterium]